MAVETRIRTLVAVLAPLLASACSLIVSTSGLTAGADTLDDAGTIVPAGVDGASSVPSSDAASGGSPTGSSDAGHAPPEAGGGGTTTNTLDAASGVGASEDAAPGVDAAGGHSGDAGPSPKDAGGVLTTECGGDLSNLGPGDFTIAFAMRMTQSGLVALLNQRASCSSGTYWDLRLSSGELSFEASDGTHDATIPGSGANLDDGSTHTIGVARVSGIVTLTVDGNDVGSGKASASFGQLAPLATGTDVCDGVDGTAALGGSLSAVCVTAR